MRNDELFIDGQLVDLDDNTKITLNYKSNIFSDLSKIVSNNSYTIKLPNTVHNQRVIEHADLPASETKYPYRNHAGRYLRNGVEIIPEANAVLLSVGSTIDFALVWGNATAFSSIVSDGKKLTELSSERYIEWKNWHEFGEVYPQIDYGFRSTETEVWYHPVVYASWILEQISKDSSLTFVFPENKKAMLNALIIPLLTRNDNEVLAKKCALTFTYKGLVPGTKRMYFTESGNGGVYGRSASETISGKSYLSMFYSKITNGIARLTGHLEVIVTGTKAPAAPTIQVCKDNQSPDGSNLEKDEVLSILAKRVDPVEGTTNKFRLTFDFEDESTSVLTNKWRESLHTVYGCYINFTFANLDGCSISSDSDVSGSFSIVNMAERIVMATSIGNGNTVDGNFYVVPNLPDIKQIDFVKGVSSILGLFAIPGGGNTIRFISIDEVTDNISKAVDWTRRVVAVTHENKPKEMSFTIDGFAQNNRFRWKEDSTVTGNYDGNIVVEDWTIDHERDVVTMPFAGTDTKGGVAQIPIYSYDSAGKLEYGSVEPRILLYEEGRGTFSGLNWSALIGENYSSYQHIVNTPRIIKENIELSDIQLKNLDLTVPVYLAQYGRYYAVISIKAEDTGICECQLLQLDL